METAIWERVYFAEQGIQLLTQRVSHVIVTILHTLEDHITVEKDYGPWSIYHLGITVGYGIWRQFHSYRTAQRRSTSKDEASVGQGHKVMLGRVY